MPLYTKNEDAPKTLSDVVIYEISPLFSRESVTLPAQAKPLALGTVLAHAADAWQPLTPGLADVDTMAVLISPVAVSDAEQTTAMLVRGVVVSLDGLVWDAGLTQNDKTTALGKLDAQGVVARS